MVLSAPSGAGKTTIAHELFRRRADLGYSVSLHHAAAASRRGRQEGLLLPDLARVPALARRGAFRRVRPGARNMYGTLRSEIARVLDRPARRHGRRRPGRPAMRGGVSAGRDRVRASPVRARCSWTVPGRKTESAKAAGVRLHSALRRIAGGRGVRVRAWSTTSSTRPSSG